MTKRLVLVALFVIVAGVAAVALTGRDGAESSPPPRQVLYRCPDGTRVVTNCRPARGNVSICRYPARDDC
jgi:hypothetical protein